MNLFNFLTSWRDPAIGPKYCLSTGFVCVCVVERRCICCRLVMMGTGAVQTRAPGRRDRTREVSQMKYDLNVHTEMGKITLTSHYYWLCYSVSPCPQDAGAHYTRALMYRRKFQCSSSRTLPPWRPRWYGAASLLFSRRIDNGGVDSLDCAASRVKSAAAGQLCRGSVQLVSFFFWTIKRSEVDAKERRR